MRNHIITTCGDANVMAGTKHINPALCLYEGCYLMCIDNKQLKARVPRGNGTCCQCVGVKLKNETTSYNWKNYYGKKVWTTSIKDTEWIECEHTTKTGSMKNIEFQIESLKRKLKTSPQNQKNTWRTKLYVSPLN